MNFNKESKSEKKKKIVGLKGGGGGGGWEGGTVSKTVSQAVKRGKIQNIFSFFWGGGGR